MDTLHEGVLEDSGMDHSEIFINRVITVHVSISHQSYVYIILNSN